MATREQKNATDLSEQAIALAEQLGRIAGTIEGTAESWMNRQTLTDQLTRVRDSATQMLEGLTGGTAKKPESEEQETLARRVRAAGRPRARARQAPPQARADDEGGEEIRSADSEDENRGRGAAAQEDLTHES